MLKEILTISLITLTPLLELRASIPFGIGIKIPLMIVLITAILTNIILGPLVYIFLNKFVHLFTRYKLFRVPYNKVIKRTQKRIQKKVEKYGEFAIALFIAVPLPGSGSYTGALAAHIIGLSYKKFIISNIIGVLISAIIVTLVSLGFFSLF
jgi:uncharacterized membrane protein